MFNKIITGILPLMPKKLVWIFSRKYIAGESVDDAIGVCRSLNAQGIKATLVIENYLKAFSSIPSPVSFRRSK